MRVMAELARVTFEVRIKALMAALEEACTDWSQERKDEFGRGWAGLMAQGAEMVQMVKSGNNYVAVPSPDFVTYCKSYGVKFYDGN